MRLQPKYIRTRLTLWYTGIFTLVLAFYVLGACVLHYWQLTDQLYHAEVQDLETVEGLLYFTVDGRLLLHEDYHSRPESKLLLDRLMEVLDEHGNVLFRNEKLKGRELGGTPLPREVSTRGYFARRLQLSDGRRVLSISHVHLFQGKRLLLRVAYSTEPLKFRLLEFLGVLALAMPFAVALAGLAGYRMAGRALAPLDEMASTTEQITASRLGDRIPVENANDELGHMAQVLNGLLARIEESFEQLKRFTSDVSHELRTPLASLRSVGEVGLQREHDAAEYENIIGSMLEEAEKLSSMIDALLSIAHADSGTAELHRTVFDLADLVQESVAIVSVLAEEKTQTISIKGDAGVCVSADRNFLRMALINLLDNAVKYSPVGSVIKLCWDSSSKQNHNTSLVKLTVEDEGPGVPERERQRVFQRFYRLDEARNRDSGGAGLGLAIAKCLVQAHGGEITLDSGSKGGSVFTIRLPITEHQLVSS